MTGFSSHQSDPVSSTSSLLKELGIKVSVSTIKSQVENPDYPSILSISDSLKHWKIDSFTTQADKEKLHELPLPFIAHVKSKSSSFITVTAVNSGTVIYQNGSSKSIGVSEFLKDWSGVTLLAEAGEHAGEKNYKQTRRKEILQSLKLPFVLSIILGIAVSSAIDQYNNSSIFAAFSLLLLLKLTGVAVSILLLWYEIDKANPMLKQICSMGGQTNCSAILSSKQAKLFNIISWSEVGFIYFIGGLLSLLFAGLHTPAILTALAWLNVLALPYTFFSVYYQWKVAKQWCPLCLAIQAILIAEFLTAVFLPTINYQSPIFFLLSSVNRQLSTAFILPALAWFLLKPLLLQSQEAKRKKRELLKFKYDQRIFDALLLKQKQVSVPPALGITIRNPEATQTITKVCNPYCRPFAKAHPEIDALLKDNKDLKVQILFTATNNENDWANKPVKHLLAVANKNNEELSKQALNDWYLADKKDYNAFVAKYTMNGELQMQDEKVEAMNEWCKEIEIAFTPTFFINGYQLPDVYNISDLTYFLST